MAAVEPGSDAEPPVVSGADSRLYRASSGARAIVSVVFGSYCVIGVLNVLTAKPGPAAVVLGVLCTAALLAIQLLYFSRPSTGLRSPASYAMLAVQAGLGYLPLLALGQSWVGQPGFVAGCALLVLPPVAGWLSFGLIVAGMAWIQGALSPVGLDVGYTTLATALTGLEVYLLTRLVRLAWELHRARAEVARGAVTEERLRFARDLHDLLGISLSAIALKAELTHRLVRRGPERARQELAEIAGLTRQTLSDMQSVATGYRELSLEQELRAADSVLTTSGVRVRITEADRELPVRVRTVLAAVLREAVTNVLRHSDAESCDIRIRVVDGTASLEVVNDGIHGPRSGEVDAGGNGVRNVATRVSEMGGTVTAGQRDDGTFRLHVTIPLADTEVQRGEGRTAAIDEGDAARPGVRTANALLIVVLAAFGAAAVLHLLYLTGSGWQIAVAVGSIAGVLALQLGYFSRPSARPGAWRGYGLLALQAVLIYLPLPLLGHNWVSLPGLLAASALLTLRPVAGWTGFVLVVASVAALHVGFGSGPQAIPFNVLATVNTALVAFGLTSLCRFAIELAGTRHRLAEVAVAEARLRFARDLHDLLGLSLSAIVVKTEFADQILLTDGDRAEAEMTEIRELSRRALADVRAVATGYRELSLDSESRQVETVLAAANVQVRMDLATEEVPPKVGTVLAMVLREGVTNALRHSKVEHCQITLRPMSNVLCLEIVNDGAPDLATEVVSEDWSAPSGIRNLSERLAALGGEVIAGPETGGRFRLRAVVPAGRS